jgi:hypothetical protein
MESFLFFVFFPSPPFAALQTVAPPFRPYHSPLVLTINTVGIQPREKHPHSNRPSGHIHLPEENSHPSVIARDKEKK